MRIGIDLIGGDISPILLFEAVQEAADALGPSHSLLVIATDSIVRQLKKISPPPPYSAKIEYRIVADAISMGDEPVGAVRRKKGSSLVVGIRLLRKRYLDAFVSPGNTGALLTSATLSLPKLPGVKRPALLAMLPTETGSVAVIDVGGNVSCKAHHLVQFAHMGAAYQRSILEKLHPTVGLLNIGIESKKGTAEVRKAYEVLRDLQENDPQIAMRFQGNIEARDVFRGLVDVLVTDGFTGNVLLKTSEGVANFIFGEMSHETPDIIQSNHLLSTLQKKFNYAEYPGAFICGVDGIVVKCHGSSTPKALLSGIKGAYSLVEKRTIEKLKQELLEKDR